MEKAHSRIKWENYPSIATPLNETNLNKMDIALDEVDNRVLGLDTAKLDKAVANTMVKDIAFNEKTGIFTITLLDGTTKTIDTKLEKVATNFSYDYETQKLVLTLVDGTKQEIDMSTLISQYEFADTSTIGFTVGNEGKITAIVKDGSITESKLQPNFLANVKTEVSKAKSYADSSYENATTSRNAVTEAKQYRDEALQFRNEAESFAPEGYADLVEQVNENTVKVDTIIEKADLGIKETASGEEIHLTDSAEGKAVEFALYGKAKQNTTTGKNLWNPRSKTTNQNGQERSGIVVENGTFTITNNSNEVVYCRDGIATSITLESVESKKTKTFTFNSEGVIWISNNNVIEDIQVEKGAVATEFEPYSGGQPSPNPQYPQPIEVSGESGSVVVTSSNKDNTKTTTAIIPTENGHAGIKVSSNGNYTDQNGQQWICDEVVKCADGSGEYVQRIGKAVFDGSEDETWIYDTSYPRFRIAVTNSKTESTRNIAVCSHGIFSTSNNVSDGIVFIYNGQFFIYNTKISSVDDFKVWLNTNVVTAYYELAEPIHTPLTAEEIAEIEKLHTFYPITNISNDFDCGMSVTYNCDSKNYIDNKIALLTTAMVNNI